MADIYRQSRQTRAWLGQLDKYSHLAFSLLERMAPLTEKENNTGTGTPRSFDSQGVALSMLNCKYKACKEFRYVPNQIAIDSASLFVKWRIIDTVRARAPWNTTYILGGSFRQGLEALTKEKFLASAHGLYAQLGAEAPDDDAKLYNRAAKVSLAYDPTQDEELYECNNELEQEIQKALASYETDNTLSTMYEPDGSGSKGGIFRVVDYEADIFIYQPEPKDVTQRRTEQSAKFRKLRSMSRRVGKRS